jgi:hypothetical protein
LGRDQKGRETSEARRGKRVNESTKQIKRRAEINSHPMNKASQVAVDDGGTPLPSSSRTGTLTKIEQCPRPPSQRWPLLKVALP